MDNGEVFFALLRLLRDCQFAGEEPGEPRLSSMMEDFLCTASSLLKAFSVASVSSSSSSDNLWQNFLLFTPPEIHSSLKLRLNIENAGSPVTYNMYYKIKYCPYKSIQTCWSILRNDGSLSVNSLGERVV